jgi:hypothetical protein
MSVFIDKNPLLSQITVVIQTIRGVRRKDTSSGMGIPTFAGYSILKINRLLT